MYASRIRAAGLAVAATIGLSACSTYGLGYSGVSVGVGNGGYYDPYYSGYGYGYPAGHGYGYGYPSGYGYGYGYPSRYGYGYGYPGSGWYNGYYYPGTGYYVYRDGRRHRWNRQQRRHFEQLRRQWHDNVVRKRRGGEDVSEQEQRRIRSALGEHRLDRPAGRVERPAVRTERRADRPERRQERRVQRVITREEAARASRSDTRQERSSSRTERKDARNKRGLVRKQKD